MQIEDSAVAAELLGEADKNKRLIEDELSVSISYRNPYVIVNGDNAVLAQQVLEELRQVVEAGSTVGTSEVMAAIAMVQNNDKPSEVFTDRILMTARNRPVAPRSGNQKLYVDAIRNNTITFGIGPAGTGKSWLAVACAVRALQEKKVERILLTRPAVEAGENLGFLPGDLMSKVDPYLRPLYDALGDMLGPENVKGYFEQNLIEVAPLAYMRGRTLNDSFVILDEAQNTTPQQMMMFLTRIGFNTTAVITGDRTQVDLPGKQSGLAEIEKVLKGIKGLAFSHLNSADVVRHKIVQDIVDAYEARSAH